MVDLSFDSAAKDMIEVLLGFRERLVGVWAGFVAEKRLVRVVRGEGADVEGEGLEEHGEDAGRYLLNDDYNLGLCVLRDVEFTIVTMRAIELGIISSRGSGAIDAPDEIVSELGGLVERMLWSV